MGEFNFCVQHNYSDLHHWQGDMEFATKISIPLNYYFLGHLGRQLSYNGTKLGLGKIARVTGIHNFGILS